MNPYNFLQAVNKYADTLTSSQKKLARHIFDHSETVAFSTARQVADAAGMSDAAVVRFSRAIGYDGFSDLRTALREGLLERAGASGMRARDSAPSDMDELKNELFEVDSLLVRNTVRLNTTATGVAIVEKMIAARHIWISGHGTTYPLAAYLSLQLNQITGKASLLNIGNGEISDNLRQVRQDDVVIGIGYARYLPYTVDIMRAARQLGASIVAITDRASSPLAALAHDSLFVARDTSSFAWWSQTGSMALCNWLVSMVMLRDAENVSQLLRSSDDVWRALGHWQSEGNSAGDLSLEEHLKAGLENRSSEQAAPDSPPSPASAASAPSAISTRPLKEKSNGKSNKAKK